ncbi:MAG: hypothetical protein ABJB86_06565 [Bacteroidota bacterium]
MQNYNQEVPLEPLPVSCPWIITLSAATAAITVGLLRIFSLRREHPVYSKTKIGGSAPAEPPVMHRPWIMPGMLELVPKEIAELQTGGSAGTVCINHSKHVLA